MVVGLSHSTDWSQSNQDWYNYTFKILLAPLSIVVSGKFMDCFCVCKNYYIDCKIQSYIVILSQEQSRNEHSNLRQQQKGNPNPYVELVLLTKIPCLQINFAESKLCFHPNKWSPETCVLLKTETISTGCHMFVNEPTLILAISQQQINICTTQVANILVYIGVVFIYTNAVYCQNNQSNTFRYSLPSQQYSL